MKARAIIEIVRDEDGDIYDLNPVNPEMHLTFRRLLNGPYAYEQVITEGMGAHWDLNTEAPDAETLDSNPELHGKICHSMKFRENQLLVLELISDP